MKKAISIISLIVILFIAITAKAQISLEHTYTASFGAFAQHNIINLTNSGYKYFVKDGDQVRLYNINHSLWKTINFVLPSDRRIFRIDNISENLFNSDNLVEFLFTTQQNIQPYPDSAFVINENGNILFKMGAVNKNVTTDIKNMGASSFKLFITIAISQQPQDIRVYSLPGTLPCDPCSGVGIVEQGSDSRQMLSNAYPNPTSGRTTIPYELPEGVNQGKLIFYNTDGKMVKEFIVDKTFKELQISNEDLYSGTYYYQMQTKNGVSEGKKLVIIK